VAIVLLLAGQAALTSLSKQLAAMHLPGVTGRGPQGFVGSSHLDLAVRQWKEFWDASGSGQRPNISPPFVSPLWLARLFMILDYLLFIPGYLVGTWVIVARNRATLRASKQAGCGPLATRSHLERLLLVTALCVSLTVLFDCLENALTLVLVGRYWSGGHQRSWLDATLTVATNAKWLLGGLVILFLLILAVARWRDRDPRTHAALRLLAPQIGLVVAVLAIFSVPIQVTDLILRISGIEALFVLLAAVLLATGMWAVSRVVVTGHERRTPVTVRGRPPLWAVVAVSLPLLAVAGWNIAADGDPIAPLIPIILAIAVFVLGWVVTPSAPCPEDPSPRDLGPIGIALPQVLAAASLALAGAAVIRAAVGSYVELGGIRVTTSLAAGLFTSSLLALAVLFEFEFRLVGAHRVSEERPRRSFANLISAAGPEQKGHRRVVYAATVAAVVMLLGLAYVLLLASPIRIPQDLGSVGIVFVFLEAASLALGGLVLLAGWWVDSYGEPRLLAAVQMRRIPVLTLLLIWAIIASLIDDGSHWGVRTLSASQATGPVPPSGISLDQAFSAWLGKASRRAGGGGRKAIPLVFVATSGGGVRAAYWTALAVDCLFGGHQATTSRAAGDPCSHSAGSRAVSPQDLFLGSGASGGSVGLVEWDANRDLHYQGSWVQDRLQGDFVSPTLARGLLSEVPRSFLHFTATARDDVLERAWEGTWAGPSPNPMTQGFLASENRRYQQGGPFLILNGSSVFDGCSLNVSLLNVGSTVDQATGQTPPTIPIGDCQSVARYTNPTGFSEAPGVLPGAADLIDYLGCQTAVDVRRSTAGLLSARFPFVSAAGRLQGCGPTASTKYIDDGGIVDDSGAESAVTAWLAIQPMVEAHNATSQASCIVPYFVQLDNGYDPMTSPRNKTKAPNQLLAPLQSLLNTTGTHSRQARARMLAADLFTRAFPLGGPAAANGQPDRYAILAPVGHPGLEASLGWTLSASSRRDLEDELYGSNAAAIMQVRDWLTNPPACPPAAG